MSKNTNREPSFWGSRRVTVVLARIRHRQLQLALLGRPAESAVYAARATRVLRCAFAGQNPAAAGSAAISAA